MPNELLSICIPTRNRSRYLKDILSAFARQVTAAGIGPEKVTFYISDNASDDQTPEVIKQFAREVPLAVCSRNEVNIGADGNNVHIRTLAKGKFLWVIGDDELLADRAVVTVLGLIEEHQPGLIIAYDSRYDSKIPAPRLFSDYREFAKECIRLNTHALAEHTLISSNIFRADCFDHQRAKAALNTFFPHMFGMIPLLLEKRATVVLPATPIISVRDWRPGPVDGQWVDVGGAWRNYFNWLRDALQMPELDPSVPSEHVRQAMLNSMFKTPLRFLATNWRLAFDPKAYRLFFNRLFRRTH